MKWTAIGIGIVFTIIIITLFVINEGLGRDQPIVEVYKTVDYKTLTKEDFGLLKIPDGKTLYYFPDECPDYTKGVYLVSGNPERYYLPEKNKLILIDADHKWTKEYDGINTWKK
jgi:hypothetical protein